MKRLWQIGTTKESRRRTTVRTSNHVGQLGAGYHNSRRSLRPRLFSDYDLYITVKRIKKIHQPFDRKPVQPIIDFDILIWPHSIL